MNHALREMRLDVLDIMMLRVRVCLPRTPGPPCPALVHMNHLLAGRKQIDDAISAACHPIVSTAFMFGFLAEKIRHFGIADIGYEIHRHSKIGDI